MPKGKKLRVVFDTNLIISAALIRHSLPDKLFRAWLQETFDLLTSKEQLEEMKESSEQEKLKKYPLFSERVTELIQNLEFAAELVKPVPDQDLSIRTRDPKDDYILSICLTGKADYLITGDKDLLMLKSNPNIGNLQILTVKEFISIINQY